MEKFKTVLDLHLKYHTALGYSVVTLLTLGGEKIFSEVVFQCPCSATWNLPYGLVFLLVPSLTLFLLGYVVSSRTWRLLTGCCASGARGKCSCRRHSVEVCVQISAAAALAPFTWVAVALLGGTFYQCLASGIPALAHHMCRGRDPTCAAQLPLALCRRDQASDAQDALRELKAQSQVLGWALIVVVIIVLLIYTSISRCRSPVSFLQLKFWKIYLEKEQQILKSQAIEHATELAKENVKSFFEDSHPKEFHTPNTKAWQQISSLYSFNPSQQYYSILHKYVNLREGSNSIESAEGDIVLPVLGFVDSSGINNASEL